MALELEQLLDVLKNPNLISKIPVSLREDFGVHWDGFVKIVSSVLDEKKIVFPSISRVSSSSSPPASPPYCGTPVSMSPPRDTGISLKSPQIRPKSLLSSRLSAFKPIKNLTETLHTIEEEVIKRLCDTYADQEDTMASNWLPLYRNFIEKIVPAIDSIWQEVMEEEHKQDMLYLQQLIKERNASDYKRGAENFYHVMHQLKTQIELSKKGLVNLTVIVKCLIHPGLIKRSILEDVVRFAGVFFYIDLEEHRGLYKLVFSDDKQANLIPLNIDRVDLSELKLKIRTSDSLIKECTLENLENDAIAILEYCSLVTLSQYSSLPPLASQSPVVQKESSSRSPKSHPLSPVARVWGSLFGGSKTTSSALVIPSEAYSACKS